MAPVLMLPVVAAPVTDKVPKFPAPVVWMVPEPALRDINTAAPAVLTDQLSSMIETPVEAASPMVIVSAPPLPKIMVSAPVEPKVMVVAEVAVREVPDTVRVPDKVVLAPDKVKAVAEEDKILLPDTCKLSAIIVLVPVASMVRLPEASVPISV